MLPAAVPGGPTGRSLPSARPRFCGGRAKATTSGAGGTGNMPLSCVSHHTIFEWVTKPDRLLHHPVQGVQSTPRSRATRTTPDQTALGTSNVNARCTCAHTHTQHVSRGPLQSLVCTVLLVLGSSSSVAPDGRVLRACGGAVPAGRRRRVAREDVHGGRWGRQGRRWPGRLHWHYRQNGVTQHGVRQWRAHVFARPGVMAGEVVHVHFFI